MTSHPKRPEADPLPGASLQKECAESEPPDKDTAKSRRSDGMNYIQLINHFWQVGVEKPFHPTDCLVYFYLLHTCNRLGWKNPFGHSDRFLANSLQLNPITIRKAKLRLQERGLIRLTVPPKMANTLHGQTLYYLVDVSKNDTPNELKNNTPNELKSNTPNELKNNTVCSALSEKGVLKNNTVCSTNIKEKPHSVFKQEEKSSLNSSEEIINDFFLSNFIHKKIKTRLGFYFATLNQYPGQKAAIIKSLYPFLKKERGQDFIHFSIKEAISHKWPKVFYPDTSAAKYQKFLSNTDPDSFLPPMTTADEN